MASQRKMNRKERRAEKFGTKGKRIPAYQLKNETVDGEIFEVSKFELHPKTAAQHSLMECIREYPITFAIGIFGTGKTYCAAGTLVKLWGTRKFDTIVLARANVPTGPTLGAFPGEPEEKLAHWVAPMLSVLRKALGSQKVDYMIEKKQIILQPIETIRGQSYENALVMVDEVQNVDLDTLKAITSRLGENSHMVLSGDPSQSDTNKGTDLVRFTDAIVKHEINIPIVYFGVDDIVRSGIAKELALMFHAENW
jgi:phosphate starvation-inducible PhoH-like protein